MELKQVKGNTYVIDALAGTLLFYKINAHEGVLVDTGYAREDREPLVRLFEETGVPYEIDRLAVIHENFFNENSGTLKGLNCHEIAFYFLMKPRGTQALNSNSYTHGAREEMHWIPIEELDKHKAFPSFLQDYLSAEHSGIEHIITGERV